MTRSEFNRHFASSLDSTEGYTVEQLDGLNDTVFASVADLYLDDDATKSTVDHAFEKAMFAFDVRMADAT